MKNKKDYMTDKRMVNFVIDYDVWEKFKALAKKKGLSASAMLRNYIISKVKKNKGI